MSREGRFDKFGLTGGAGGGVKGGSTTLFVVGRPGGMGRGFSRKEGFGSSPRKRPSGLLTIGSNTGGVDMDSGMGGGRSAGDGFGLGGLDRWD